MASKIFEELLAKIPADQKKEVDQIKGNIGDGLDNRDKLKVVDTIDAPTPPVNTTKDAAAETGYNIDIQDAAATKGNNSTFSEVVSKPTTATAPEDTDAPKSTV
jgi:hypothetical protein